MDNATFTTPDLDTFCRLNEFGLTAARQRIEPDRAVLDCRIRTIDALDQWCRRRGQQGVLRGTATRRLAVWVMRFLTQPRA